MQEADSTPNPVKDVQLEDTVEVAVAATESAPISDTNEVTSATTGAPAGSTEAISGHTENVAREPAQDIGTLLRAEHMRAFPSRESRDAEDAYMTSLSFLNHSSSPASSFDQINDGNAVSRLPARRSNAVRQFQNQVLGRHTRKSHWHGKKASFISAT